MNCSVCNRNNAVTLSICPSCGTMIHDSVRKELVPKVSNVSQRLNFELTENKIMPNKIIENCQTPMLPKTNVVTETATTEITIKSTSPTLVEFHNKNAAVPEWRLQLQNVVRQRHGREAEAKIESSPTSPKAQSATSGANALKAQPVEQAKTVQHKNPTLSSALERIEKSRRQFLEAEKMPIAFIADPPKANKNYPFHIAGKTADAASNPAEINQPINSFAKPKLATSLGARQIKLDTNKLPAIPESTNFARNVESQTALPTDLDTTIHETLQPKVEIVETARTEIKSIKTTEISEAVEAEEFDDCAPFAARFNAGLFDLIIGSFVSLLLLAPFMLFSGNWLSVAGVFAFLATCAIVMFVYLTTTIGFYGKTFGMRLFSLEIVDVENEEYPTFHQAAVSSAVYLLSLALGGIGFLTLPFNEDRRAVHDLVSGTIIIKEE